MGVEYRQRELYRFELDDWAGVLEILEGVEGLGLGLGSKLPKFLWCGSGQLWLFRFGPYLPRLGRTVLWGMMAGGGEGAGWRYFWTWSFCSGLWSSVREDL
jgi:hypothetical protein